MKKFIAKIVSGVVALAAVAMTFAATPMLNASAADNSVKVYYKNTTKWANVYLYTYQGSGSTGKAWPGTQMKDLGNGWFEATYTGTKALNCVFNDNGKPTTKQTANHDPADLDITKSAWYFVPGTSEEDNAAGMGGGVTLTVFDSAEKAGFPAETTANESKATTKTDTSSKTAATKDNTPKTGDANYLPIAGTAAVVAIAGIALLSSKKRVKA